MKVVLCALLALIAVGGVYSQVDENTSLSNSGEQGVVVGNRECIPSPCARMYRPVCASVNGIPMTVPTMCDYENKLRCMRELQRPGEILPEILMLHLGACTENDPSVLTDASILKDAATAKRRNQRNKRQRRRN